MRSTTLTMTTVPTAAYRDGRPDRDGLGDELLRVAVEQTGVGGLDGGRGEDAGRDGAEHPADTVDGEDVEGVIDAERAAGASRCSTVRRRRGR